MTIKAPFKPHYGSNQVITTGASASYAINKTDKSVRLSNTGSGIAYFRIGEGVQTANATDCLLMVGQTMIVEKGMDHDNIAIYSPAASQVQVITGEGGYL